MDKSRWRVLREEEWYRVYSSPEHPRIYESKFATGEARISLPELRARWEGWNEGERVQFAQAFAKKRDFGSEDQDMLGFLMEQDGEMISSSIATLATKHYDKKYAARFLVGCLRAFPKSRGNFLMALCDLAAPETLHDLSAVFQQCSRDITRHPRNYDSVADMLYSAAALFKVTGNRKYLRVIASYARRRNQQVRCYAENAMRWAGPSP
jgi:hypothetical protein